MPRGIYPRPSLRERVLRQLVTDQESGCLLWAGCVRSNGYAYITCGSKLLLVHRLMYEWFVGPIPEGLELDHLCRVTRCAAPAHLEAVTHRVNMLRSKTPAAANAVKNHCDRGHEFDLLNTYFTPQGFRQCRECNRAAERRRGPRGKTFR